MKLVDQYIVRSLLTPLCYCLTAFTILIIIHDLFDHLSDFLEAGTPTKDILLYYVYLLPSLLYLIVPISLLLAVLYCLSSLTKNNELTAMRASGISLYRLMMPIIATGFAFTLLVGVVHEVWEPWSKYWTDQFIRYQKKKGEIVAHISTDLAYKNNRTRRIWRIDEFNTETFEMKNVSLTQERENGTTELRMVAREARWLDGTWWFYDVVTQELDEQGDPVRQFDADGKFIGLVRQDRDREMTALTETPRDFINETKDPEFLSTAELRNFVASHDHLSGKTKARYKVNFYHRLATPWMSLIVTLLGIPFGSQTARKGAFAGIALSIGLFFSYYFLMNFGLWLGKEQLLPAWLGAWFPNMIFLSIGLCMVYRMR